MLMTISRFSGGGVKEDSVLTMVNGHSQNSFRYIELNMQSEIIALQKIGEALQKCAIIIAQF